jgi:hypothetical protein
LTAGAAGRPAGKGAEQLEERQQHDHAGDGQAATPTFLCCFFFLILEHPA